jgi:hypothetical protein
MSDRSSALHHNVSNTGRADHEPALDLTTAPEAASHTAAPNSIRTRTIAEAVRRIVPSRRLSPLAGAILILFAHAIHMLALPLLALLIGTQTGSDGTAPLFSHDHHTVSSTPGGLFGANGLLLKWISDLLVAATIVTAIAMCRATTRLWLRVRQHPLLCIVHTAIAALCVWLAVS